MPADTVCKIIRQYNQEPVSPEDMQKLQEIAGDYTRVKNEVYQRYSGIKSLPKLYPGYTVQNEMTKSGLRERLGLPSVYFYLAVFDALKEIKICWSGVRATVLKKVNAHEGLTEEEKHFLRYVLKVSGAFESALNGSPLKLPKELQRQYDALAVRVDVKKLTNYLHRQVRRYSRKLHAETAEGFAVAERAYRYGDHGIYLSVKEKRKRIFIPLTDGNCYTRQLYVRLYPERGDVEIRVPVDIAVREHADYDQSVGLSMGMTVMLTTDEGHTYGADLGDCQARLSDWLREQSSIYHRNRDANPGRKKYLEKKRRMEEQLHGYINQELNRFLRTEKPKVVYLPKLPKPGAGGPVKRMNHLASTWQRGYIRKRLALKCEEQSVELAEVFGKDISRECSVCGNAGERRDGKFVCPFCGYEADPKQNAARNAKCRGERTENDENFTKIIRTRHRVNEGGEL